MAARGPAAMARRIGLDAGDGDRRRRSVLVVAVLAVLAAATAIVSLGVGASGIGLDLVIGAFKGLFRGEAAAQRDMLVVFEIRAPRAIACAGIGAALGVSGALLQALFRNPLADPALIGITSGASLAAVTVIVFGLGSVYTLPVAAFLGGLATTIILYGIATRRGRTSVATMLLAGIALSALAMAVTGSLIFISDDRALRDLTFWTLGSLAGSTWEKALVFLAIATPIAVLAPRFARPLDALLLGEAEARQLGFDTQRLKAMVIVSTALLVGASVAVAGPIGFVGLVVPHMLRLVIGPSHRGLIPASALLGAMLLLLADMTSRVVVAPAELPIGIVTALFGAPFFLWLLLRSRALVDI